MTENQLKYLAYQESARHNLAAEELNRQANQELARSNLAKETETNRANVARETDQDFMNALSASRLDLDTDIAKRKQLLEEAKFVDRLVDEYLSITGDELLGLLGGAIQTAGEYVPTGG